MKNIIYILTLLSTILLISSCRDEDVIRMPELQEGVNMRLIVDPAKSFIDFENLGTTTYEFDAYSVNKNLQTVELIGTYIDASEEDTIRDRTVLTLRQADFPNGKARGVITPTMVASAFGIPGGVAGLGAGDILNMETKVTLTDGRVFTAENSAPSIALANNASFTVALNTFIGCPSDIKVGTYTTVASGTSTDTAPKPNPTVNFPGTVTITRLTPTSYKVSDVTGGMYSAWYLAAYGAPESMPGTLIDICGSLSLSAGGPFGENLTGTTTISDAGVITFEWENEFGDTGKTVFTPK
jgi:hypothetical protein